MTPIRIALDWTPNTNHSGFFMAQALGWFQEAGLQVHLLTPDADLYTTTPMKQLELGMADLAVAPLESVVSYRTKTNPFDPVAIAALLQADVSSIAVLAGGPIRQPRQLDGACYASYKARYEDGIVQQLVRNDGGKGTVRITYPPRLGIWNTLLDGGADATWIFDNWEGVWANRKGLVLRTFRMADYGIPYGYSPVLVGSEGELQRQPALWQQLLQVLRRGYAYAATHPQQAAEVLLPLVAPADHDPGFLLESQQYTAPYYGGANWGKMEERRVTQWLGWLHQQGLEPVLLSATQVVDLRYLQA